MMRSPRAEAAQRAALEERDERVARQVGEERDRRQRVPGAGGGLRLLGQFVARLLFRRAVRESALGRELYRVQQRVRFNLQLREAGDAQGRAPGLGCSGGGGDDRGARGGGAGRGFGATGAQAGRAGLRGRPGFDGGGRGGGGHFGPRDGRREGLPTSAGGPIWGSSGMDEGDCGARGGVTRMDRPGGADSRGATGGGDTVEGGGMGGAGASGSGVASSARASEGASVRDRPAARPRREDHLGVIGYGGARCFRSAAALATLRPGRGGFAAGSGSRLCRGRRAVLRLRPGRGRRAPSGVQVREHLLHALVGRDPARGSACSRRWRAAGSPPSRSPPRRTGTRRRRGPAVRP